MPCPVMYLSDPNSGVCPRENNRAPTGCPAFYRPWLPLLSHLLYYLNFLRRIECICYPKGKIHPRAWTPVSRISCPPLSQWKSIALHLHSGGYMRKPVWFRRSTLHHKKYLSRNV